MPALSWKSVCAKSLLVIGGATLAGCQGLLPSKQPTRVDWDWDKTVVFTTPAIPGKKVFLEWQEVEVESEISADIQRHIASVLRDNYGLVVTSDPAGVDYHVQLCLRYFNENEKADHGASILTAAGTTYPGGLPEWIVVGEGPIGERREPKRIPTPTTSSKREMVLLIDVAVGEKGGDRNHPEDMVLRHGRLIGCLPSRGLTRDEVLWYFKYNTPPPQPPEDGPVPASFPLANAKTAPEALLEVLIPGILPLQGLIRAPEPSAASASEQEVVPETTRSEG